MALLSEDHVRSCALERAKEAGRSVADELESVSGRTVARYDVFLSQTIRDAEIVLGVYSVLTEAGLCVFCDWVQAPSNAEKTVMARNAAFIRRVMDVSDSLLFIDAEGAEQSRWMCWELGYFDGLKGRVGVLPVVRRADGPYVGREFLGLYPRVELDHQGRLRVVKPYSLVAGAIMMQAPKPSRPLVEWVTAPRGTLRP